MSEKAIEYHRMRQDVLADLHRLVDSYGRDDRHIIVLDDYEVSNLRSALQACGYGLFDKGPDGKHQPSPLDVLHTGDWLGQIFQKLPYVESRVQPNADLFELRQRAREFHVPAPAGIQGGRGVCSRLEVAEFDLAAVEAERDRLREVERAAQSVYNAAQAEIEEAEVVALADQRPYDATAANRASRWLITTTLRAALDRASQKEGE